MGPASNYLVIASGNGGRVMRVKKVRGLAALGAAAIVAAVGMGGASPARADVPVGGVGWWTRSPSPPTVPQGGLSVGEAPDDDVSVAAIRLATGEGGATGVTITLTESGGEAQQAASLQVCTTTDAWNAAAGDPIELAPRPTCPADPLLLERDDAGTWTADLTPLLVGMTGDVSIMIVPGPAPASVPGVADAGVFQIAFAPPAVAGTLTAPPDSSSSFGSPSTSPSPSPAFSVPASSVAQSPAFAPVGAQPSAVLPSSQADATVSTPDAGGGQVSFPVAGVGSSTKPKSKAVILAMVAFSIIVGGAAAALRMAQERGVFERLIPSGRGSSLKLPS